MGNSQIVRVALTLGVGSVGAFLFSILALPLPWLLGALIATVVASLAGAPVEIRPGLRRYLVCILGVILGGTFSPEVLVRAGEWLPTLAAAVGYLVLVTLVAQFYCRLVMKMDGVTAIFTGMPGGLSEMVILGEEQGADVRALTLTHAVRVASVLLVIPFFLTYGFGLEGQTPPLPEETWNRKDLLILGVTAVAGYFGGKAVRLPAHALTGPMLLSAVVHLSGLVVNDPPPLASLIIQLVMGSALGARFFGFSIARVGKIMILAVGLGLTMMTVTLFSAALMSTLTGLPFEALVIALSPGGFAEMTLAALSMNIDPAFVATHHGLRLLIIVFITPIVLSFWLKRRRQI
ncbi:MAG: AbrB family transcriptional regulator [Gammaproteobacteria bacterium]|nr:AbrB family transcriptional regulator [Gammaproteobacteria bacterium]